VNRITKTSLWFLAALLLPPLPARPQMVLITFDHPFQSQTLRGTVSDPTGASVMGVLIEDCDTNFKQVRASTWTDENGHFTLRHGRIGTTHFLRVSKDGFDPMQITVQLRRSADPELSIKLHIAT
jgi:hypothetical protein